MEVLLKDLVGAVDVATALAEFVAPCARGKGKKSSLVIEKSLLIVKYLTKKEHPILLRM